MLCHSRITCVFSEQKQSMGFKALCGYGLFICSNKWQCDATFVYRAMYEAHVLVEQTNTV